MATIQITVPDAIVGKAIAALKRRYPDLTGSPAEIAQQALALLVRETLEVSERDRVEKELRGQLERERDRQLELIREALNGIG